MKAQCILPKHGHVDFLQKKKGVEVGFNLSGFQPFQTHAIHIHEFFSPSLNCAEMGGHFNPDGSTHGSACFPSFPRHAGDLINNFTTDQHGNFRFNYVDNLISLSGQRNIIRRSVVIHASIDDLGAGGREINGVFVPYSMMEDQLLRSLCQEAGYKGLSSKKERIQKLEEESLKTGNAGRRIACGNIVSCK